MQNLNKVNFRNSPSFSVCVDFSALALPSGEAWEWLEMLPFTFDNDTGYQYRQDMLDSYGMLTRF